MRFRKAHSSFCPRVTSPKCHLGWQWPVAISWEGSPVPELGKGKASLCNGGMFGCSLLKGRGLAELRWRRDC